MRQPIPVREVFQIELDEYDRLRLAGIARKLCDNDPSLSSTNYFGSGVTCGLGEKGPALLIGDQSEISLMGTPEELLFEYRMAMLGTVGDILVISHSRSVAYESYLRDYLGIDVDVLIAASQPSECHWPLTKRCLHQESMMRYITERARSFGSLSIVPYISTGHAWNLARAIAENAGVDVTVAGPPPRLARRINDKLWFSYRVREVLGSDALSSTIAAYGPAALAAHVKRLASKTEKLVIKVPDSAGSNGNLSLEASQFRNRNLGEISAPLSEMLASLGWNNAFPLKVEIWETPVLASPSVQIWIPQRNQGLPVIEGLFEQMIEGTVGKFEGAIKSRMPSKIQNRILQQAMTLAFLFQQLGYYGRCSLDALLVGFSYNEASLRWIECNGRWGGVSVPMTMVNRLLDDPAGSEIMIVQKAHLDLPAKPIHDAINILGGMLFRRGKSLEGIILLSPTGYEQGRGVHFLALAKTLERARELSLKCMKRLHQS